MNISEKFDAEVINRAVFRANDALKKDSVFYKCGLVILSGNGKEFEQDIKHIDRITGVIDHFTLRGEMKKALLYTKLLNKKVNELIEKTEKTEVVLPSAE